MAFAMQRRMRMLPKRILCPIDFSDGSRAALKAAAELAQVCSAEITLLNVFPRPAVGGDALSEVVTESALSQLGADARSRLASWKAEAEALGAKNVAVAAASGSPWEVIVKTAEKDRIQAIVMSTHGRTGFQRAFLGSVAEKVVRHAPCGVYVVRPQPD
jgi:universal stress protein A